MIIGQHKMKLQAKMAKFKQKTMQKTCALVRHHFKDKKLFEFWSFVYGPKQASITIYKEKGIKF